MTPARAAFVAVACALLVGCGGGARNVIRTGAFVTGLALDGKRLAWTDCHRIHVLERDREVSLRLPGTIARDACETEGRLVLAGSSVGWFFATSDRSHHSVLLGVSSTRSRSTSLLSASRLYDEKADAGLHGAIAGDDGSILWTWPRVSLLGPEDAVHYCDRYSRQSRCRIRIRDAAVHAWSGRRVSIVGGVPPAGPIAASHGWIAVGVIAPGTFPQSRETAPHVVVVARRRDGLVLARVRSPRRVEAVALSHRLLAVEEDGRIVLYRLPGGRLLRVARLGRRGHYHLPTGWMDYRFTGSIAVAGDDLVVWDVSYVELIDATTGRTTVVARTPASYGRRSDRLFTALASDGNRLAWATTDRHGSVIRIRSLRGTSSRRSV